MTCDHHPELNSLFTFCYWSCSTTAALIVPSFLQRTGFKSRSGESAPSARIAVSKLRRRLPADLLQSMRKGRSQVCACGARRGSARCHAGRTLHVQSMTCDDTRVARSRASCALEALEVSAPPYSTDDARLLGAPLRSALLRNEIEKQDGACAQQARVAARRGTFSQLEQGK